MVMIVDYKWKRSWRVILGSGVGVIPRIPTGLKYMIFFSGSNYLSAEYIYTVSQQTLYLRAVYFLRSNFPDCSQT